MEKRRERRGTDQHDSSSLSCTHSDAAKGSARLRPLLARLVEGYIPVTESGCWIWLKGTDTDGYGKIGVDGVSVRAYRVSYELFRGPITQGLEPDHLCRVRCCINPFHIELVSHKENTLRGNGPTAINARRTHCVNGHPFDEANTYFKLGGGRSCRRCKYLWKLKHKDDGLTATGAPRPTNDCGSTSLRSWGEGERPVRARGRRRTGRRPQPRQTKGGL